MHDHIGETAGKIWDLLQEKEEVNIAQISRTLKIKSAEAYQAVGWLAREDKINYEERGSKTFISLK